MTPARRAAAEERRSVRLDTHGGRSVCIMDRWPPSKVSRARAAIEDGVSAENFYNRFQVGKDAAARWLGMTPPRITPGHALGGVVS